MNADANRLVLVVEDDPIIAFDLEAILNELSCDPVVVFSNNADALKWLENETPALAILDFKLTKETSLETAVTLDRRSVPMAFVTGYGIHVPLPETLADCPVFNKPVAKADLAAWVSRAKGKGLQNATV